MDSPGVVGARSLDGRKNRAEPSVGLPAATDKDYG
jgi:hypothetical protein